MWLLSNESELQKHLNHWAPEGEFWKRCDSVEYKHTGPLGEVRHHTRASKMTSQATATAINTYDLLGLCLL